jgi:hypothetical protein
MLILDPPAAWTLCPARLGSSRIQPADLGIGGQLRLQLRGLFPRIRHAATGQTAVFGHGRCRLFCSNWRSRGVWKTPAGSINYRHRGLELDLTDQDRAAQPLGINCLRNFRPLVGGIARAPARRGLLSDDYKIRAGGSRFISRKPLSRHPIRRARRQRRFVVQLRLQSVRSWPLPVKARYGYYVDCDEPRRRRTTSIADAINIRSASRRGRPNSSC